nr:reverse transcriptase domain-containing protein [Tanacetum cinerariifolium]
MSEQEELNLSPPTSAVRNTLGKGKEQTSKNSSRLASDTALQEYCNKYYHQLLPIIAKKIRCDRSESPKHRPEGRRDGGVFNRLGGKKETSSRDTKYSSKVKIAGVDTGNQGRRRQSRALKKMNFLNHGYEKRQIHSHPVSATLNSKKDPNAKQRQNMHVKGASECMRIFGFMHEITNPELIKRLHDKIPKLVEEMMRATTAFLWGERLERRRDKFTLLAKSPKEILALDKGKFKASPPMTTLVEKRTAISSMNFMKKLCPEVKKPNGSSYRTPHRLQWRNNMAIGTNIVAALGMLKFPVPEGILTLRSSRISPLKCTMVSGLEAQPSDIIQAAEERIKVAIHPEYPE